MSKEVAKVEPQYPALVADPATFINTLRENLGGMDLSPFDLDRVSIPAGGGLAWTVPGLDGDQAVPKLTGVILGTQTARAYWSSSFEASGGGTPPDCTSDDGITGHGSPGGSCMNCPNAQWGSDSRGGGGQACRQVMRVFLLRAGESLPLVLTLPPTSIKPGKKYLLRLASAGVPVHSVESVVSLEKDKSGSGIAYSKASFGIGQRLSPEEAAAARAFAGAILPILKRTVSAQEFEGGGE